MENKILIFRTSITRKCDIKRIEKLLAQYPQDLPSPSVRWSPDGPRHQNRQMECRL